MNAQGSFFDPPDPYTRARRGDPVTSLEAAGSLAVVRLTKVRQGILDVLRAHPDGLSDEQIAAAYFHGGFGPKASPSGLRTRRSELVEGGLIADSGRRTRTQSGRRTIVWVLVLRGSA